MLTFLLTGVFFFAGAISAASSGTSAKGTAEALDAAFLGAFFLLMLAFVLVLFGVASGVCLPLGNNAGEIFGKIPPPGIVTSFSN
jgi:hypothetical protein